MKFNLTYIASTAIALTIATACNNVSEDDRFILVETHSLQADTTEFAQRTLIEEYTGQMCVNCPEGHKTMETIAEAVPGKVVIISIHSGALAVEEPNGLMTADGDTYAQRYGVTAYPSIVINRRTEAIRSVNTWSAEVNKYISNVQAPAAIEIKTETRTNPDATITVDISSTLTANGADMSNLKYQVILTQNNLVSWQALPDNSYDLEYVFDHVYHKSANGVDGDNVSINAGNPTEHKCTVTYTPPTPESEAAIVGILYDANGVVQVVEQYIDTEE